MKVRPEELARYLVRPNERGRVPPDWAALFGRRGPLAVEVGFGGGEYLAWWAGRRPDWNLVGLERPLESVVRAGRRCALAGVENVRLVRGDARYLLRELFHTGSLAAVVMQFPMPWPKDRHAKHRVASEAFARTLADVMQAGALFEMITDQGWYARDARSALAANPAFETAALEEDPVREFRTRYERKWLEVGRSIFRVAARLKEPVPAPRICLPGPMLACPLPRFPAARDLTGLVGARYAADGCVAEVKEAFQSESAWLFRVLTADESFSQLFFLRVQARQDGTAVLKVEEHPRPYFTRAVRFLVESAAQALAGPTAGTPPGRST